MSREATLKQMIEGAFVEAGGQKYLVRLAKKRPDLFLPLLGLVLPQTVEFASSLEVRVEVQQRARKDVERPEFLKAV